MTVYIVEDDPGVADSLSIILEENGCETAVFNDAETFMKMAVPAPEDVAIVDLGLPGIGGDDAVRWLNSREKPPRIIVISGQPRNVIERHFNGDVAPVVLRKPLTEEVLLRWL